MYDNDLEGTFYEFVEFGNFPSWLDVCAWDVRLKVVEASAEGCYCVHKKGLGCVDTLWEVTRERFKSTSKENR